MIWVSIKTNIYKYKVLISGTMIEKGFAINQ